MLIRLELALGNKLPEGIYQGIDEFIYTDYCNQTSLLPMPDWEVIEDVANGETVIFWFTVEGWRKYGTYFSGLVYGPQAYDWLVEHDGIIHAYIIKNEDKYDIAWEDEYQVGLWYEECQDLFFNGPQFVIHDIDSWKHFEESLGIF